MTVDGGSAAAGTSLPDRLERIGVVLGATVMLSMPMGVLGISLLNLGWAPWSVAIVALGPGLVIGVLVATERVPIPYQRIWGFSLASWVAMLAIFGSTGSNSMTADGTNLVAYWIAGLLVGAVFASRRWWRSRLL